MPQPDENVTIKALGALEIKSEETGEVEAIVATLGVVDKDFEVITKDAIPDGSKVKLSAYGHDAVFGELPVGKGAIHIEGDKAIFRGKYFLAVQRAADAFHVLKEMGRDQPWSFGFRVLGAEVPDDEWRKKGARRILTKLDAFEVSPVMVAAGEGTRTLAVKCDGCGEAHEGETCAPCQAKAEQQTQEAAKRAAEEQAKADAVAAVNTDAARIFARGKRFTTKR